MVAVLLTLTLAMVLQGQTAEGYSNWYNVVEKRFGIAGTFSSMRDVDFQNLRIYLLTENGAIDAVRKLKNGRYSRPGSSEDGFQDIWVEEVHIVPSDAGKPERAVVTFVDSSGGASTCNARFIQLFELSNQRLVLTQQIKHGSRSGGYRLDWDQGRLWFYAVDFCDDVEPYRLRVQFRWDGQRFRKESATKVPRGDR